MTRWVLDTQLFIEAARHREAAEQLSAFSSAFLPRLHLHAVVVQEMLAGATSREWRREILRGIVAPYERRGRTVTPSYRSWRRSGEILAELLEQRRITPGGIRRSFLNDVLLAVSCREEGLTVITRNAKDFQLIGSVEPVRFVDPWPTP